ncbi:hypothetical protein [Pseudonocardia sp. H11422]|uniref:hypothetical protein n=1 Tax=Pseudonocardia sp. H11422 TaxID=2835866 RepID=UPI001BDCE815|nr:hypothetical protein [Pseudonocardia sp. H11422]
MSDQVASDVVDLLRAAYRAFNTRDVEGCCRGGTPTWSGPTAWRAGTSTGATVCAYWTCQWQLVGPAVEPLAFVLEPYDRIRVNVHQRVVDRSGVLVTAGLVQHIYRIHRGLITRMDIRLP